MLYSSYVYFKHIGFSSSLDSLLSTTTEARLPQCSPIPTSQMKESDAKPSQPAVDQKTAPADRTASDSALSHVLVSKGDSPHTSDSTHPHSRSVDKSTSTAPCDSETSSREMNQSKIQTPSTDITAIDSASVANNSEPAYKAMISSHDKLVTALSMDVIKMSGAFVEKEFITPEMSSKMLLSNFTEREKATILVNAITDKINIAPKRFDELVKIFSEQTCTKDIVDSLLSLIKHKEDDEDETEDCDTEETSSSQQYAVCEDQMYTAWEKLTPDGKLDLEARLTTEAEAIRKEFALLCWRARDSFEQRNIKPRTLASALLDLTVHEDSPDSSSLLKEEEEALMRAESVHDTFDVLRPHMNFFNYEILQFLIEGKGSKEDKSALAKFLKNFKEFCKRHVFEVPFSVYSNGHNSVSENTIRQQQLHVKITERFKSALLIKTSSESVQSMSDSVHIKKVCSDKLEICLEDAKNIQRKLAQVLNLKPSSLFLESIQEGSIILTFLLPVCVSLVGLDHNPKILTNGIHVLSGPGKPKVEEITQSGIIVGWSPPEYGCDSLAKYQLNYQKISELEISQWQKLGLTSLVCRTCLPELSDGCM